MMRLLTVYFESPVLCRCLFCVCNKDLANVLQFITTHLKIWQTLQFITTHLKIWQTYYNLLPHIIGFSCHSRGEFMKIISGKNWSLLFHAMTFPIFGGKKLVTRDFQLNFFSSLSFMIFSLTHSHTMTPFDAPGKQAF